MSVAKTILEQLGGSRFVFMTGAKSLTDHGNALSFRLPGAGGFTKEGINYVKVTLNDADLYDLEFSRVRKLTVKTLHRETAIPVENLREVFRLYTGLVTSLGTMGR